MKKKGSTAVLVITVMVFAVAMTLAGLSVFMEYTGRTIVMKEDQNPEEGMSDYDKFAEIDEFIQNSYIGEYDRDFQMDQVYRTMVDELGDQYSRYMTEEEQKQLQQDINSSFTGTGIVFVKNEDGEGFLITEVVEGGPADAVGVKEEDIILKVDGIAYDDAVELGDAIKGESGSSVVLTILRGTETKDYPVVRGDVQGASVESRSLEDGIGYIRIRSFGEDTFKLFDAAITELEAKNKALIIDLRNNGGGIFESGVQVADRILPECAIAYTQNKNGEREIFNSDSKKTGLKLFVLINGSTGSTAEMLAETLRVNAGAEIIGEKSYGKGYIQEHRVFSDNTAINLTVKEFFVVEGSKIEGVGIKPTTTVYNTTSGTKDLQLEKAVEKAKATV